MIGGRRGRLVVLALGAAGLIACAVAWTSDARLFMAGWLVAILFWLGLSLGAMPLLMAHGLTGGAWGEATEPALRAALTALPVALVALVVPLAFGLSRLFPWTRPVADLPEVVVRKAAWLDPSFFAGRTVVYGALWLLLAWFLEAWRHDAPRRRRLSAGGPILWVFTVTFFGFDWLMSLEPEWYSDIFGIYLVAQFGLAGMAFALLATCRDDVPWDGARRSALQDFANLLIAAAVGWLFIDFSQYLIIWMANLPHEIIWYLHRREPLWQALSLIAFAGLFVVPLSVFLFRRCKRSRAALAVVAAIVLLGHLAQCAWLVLPSAPPVGWRGLAMAAVAWVAIGGPWLFVFLARLAVLPRRDLPLSIAGEPVHD